MIYIQRRKGKYGARARSSHASFIGSGALAAKSRWARIINNRMQRRARSRAAADRRPLSPYYTVADYTRRVCLNYVSFREREIAIHFRGFRLASPTAGFMCTASFLALPAIDCARTSSLAYFR